MAEDNSTCIVRMSEVKNEFDLLYYVNPSLVITQRILLFIICGFGLFGNMLSAVIWSSRKQRKRSNSSLYLMVLSLLDVLIIIFWIVIQINLFLKSDSPKFIRLYFDALQHCNITIAFGFTLERWICVRFPFDRHRLCSTGRTILAIAVLLILPIAIHTLRFFTNDGELLEHINLIITEVTFSLVTTVATLAFNIDLVREMKKLTASNKSTGLTEQLTDVECNGKTRMRENSSFISTTAMLIVLSFYLLTCNLTAGAMWVWQKFVPEPDSGTDMCLEMWRETPGARENIQYYSITVVVSIFTYTHYAINFAIFFFMNPSFRVQVRQIMCCRRNQSFADSFHTRDTMGVTYMRETGRSPDKQKPEAPISINSMSGSGRTRVNHSDLLNGGSLSSKFRQLSMDGAPDL